MAPSKGSGQSHLPGPLCDWRETTFVVSQIMPSGVAMAPSSDMFELGVKVRVLRRGTAFAARAGRLYEIAGARRW
jgi:hypothetical protein